MAQQTGAIYHQGILYSGGSGTNVTPNPQGEATDTLNTVEIDGTVYGIEGGSGTVLIDSAIDESRRLFESTEITKFNQTPVTYTATEDCYAICIFKGSTGTNMRPIINGKAISFIALNDMISTILPLKKGDVISNRYEDVSEDCYFKMCIYGRKPAGAISAPVIYSDEERQIGVWRDNKPLYQKTIDIGTLPNAGQKLVNHNISDFGEVVRVFGYARNTSNNASIPLPHTHPNGANQSTSLIITTTQISVQTGTDRSGYAGYVTVQYTKASDTAGSGEYNTLAIPNVHYSTDEQVIGTWIDGKTLYQKTKIFPNTIAFSNDTVLDMEISNVDTIFVEEGYFYDYYANAIGKLPYSQNGNLQYTISVKVDISNKSHLKISSNTTFEVNSDRYIAVTVRYTKTTD